MMEQLSVRILDREYRLSCVTAEKPALLDAVAHVDAQMHAIRDQGKIVGTERIAVFAALNIASALLATRSSKIPAPVASEDFARRMQSINAVLDAALAPRENLI